MSWGLFAAGLAKTTAKELAERDRKDGQATKELGPQPVSNVVPGWLATLAGVSLGAMILGIVAFALRLHSHHATADEATIGMLWSAAICGLPGVVLAIAAWRGFRKNALSRRTEGARGRA